MGQGISRRRFVEGTAAGVAAIGLPGRYAGARPAELTGKVFNLEVGRVPVNVTGSDVTGIAINGSVPAPRLRWREGETVTLNVHNTLDTATSIHWHGILLPWQMDGVPGVSFRGIAPGESFTYRFRVHQSGTYWYHSHSGFQEQLGMYGPIVIDPATGGDRGRVRHDETIVLSDWTDTNPMRVFQRLKKLSHYYNFNRRTLADMRQEIDEYGWAGARAARAMWNRMRMTDRDLADVTGAAYTYLMNGVPPAGNWKLPFDAGERMRLRFINASAMTIFDVRIPGLDMTVVATDGQPVEPVTVSEFRIGVAETFDVLVTPVAASAYSIFAQSIDRLGYARGTLTPDPGIDIDPPPLDPPPVLTMRDMAMDPEVVRHEAMGHAATGPDSTGHSHAAMPASGHSMHRAAHDAGAAPVVTHAPAEFGPGVAMRAASPARRFDDPGVGLRDRSWRVLTYGALRYAGRTLRLPDYDRELEIHLTGNMERYMWSFDGTPAHRADRIELALGERVRFRLINDTMMTHPIHLHGLWSDLETGTDSFARKHTIVVQPGQEVACGVLADAPGPWAYHCHLLYHMEAGMFRVVHVG